MTTKSLVVAKFEFVKTVRRKGFILGTIGLPLLMLFVMGLSLYTGAGIGTGAANQTTGYVDAAGFVQAAPGFVQYPDVEAGKAALVNGNIHSLLLVPPDYFRTGTLTVYTLDNSLLGSAGSSQVVQEFMTTNLLRHENVSDQAAQKILSPVSPTVIVLDEAGNPKGDQKVTGFVLPFALTMVLAIGILTSSGYLMQGIGEEKESRRGEFLLSHCSAEELLAGKILGYAGVGLLQIVVWVAIGLAVIAASPFATLFSEIQVTWLVCLAVIYFVLGYFLFSVSIACTASLAPTVREAQQVSAVFSMFAVFPLIFLQFLLQDPNSLLMQVLTYFPYTAPFVAMVRLTLVTVPPYQIIVSIAILVISIVILTRLAARIFRMGMLTYGKRVSFREVLRFLKEK
ncbi:ABC transporter permease [Methanoregula sp.]|uniref:ABC transporter permease n=1 Tax=Methanoregula sp. TaxID=2052170 RepID=UPI00236D7E9B|nr:ABC transporter permease [Methanoregula sp.]MDD1686740.1 ABC transporter permease [Methanoregula sp.]